MPQPPSWNGHFSNGPTYAQQLAALLHMQLDDRAFGYAEASDAPPTLSVDPAGNPFPINLSDQVWGVGGYIAELGGQPAPAHTSALINIGSNDYLGYLLSDLPKDPQTSQALVADVVANIEHAIDDLTQAGVENIILFTLPDLGTTPLAQLKGPDVVQAAHTLEVWSNALLVQMAAGHDNVRVVDIFQPRKRLLPTRKASA